MAHKNGEKKDELKKLYGDGCFYLRGNIDKKIKGKVIKTYKEYKKTVRFKGKNIESQITFHHLRHKSEHGETTVENGANLCLGVHRYIHTLPREQEEIINNELRKFKYNIDVACLRIQDNQIEIQDKSSIDFNKSDIIELDVYNQNEKYHSVEQNYYTEKQEMQRLVQKYVDR